MHFYPRMAVMLILSAGCVSASKETSRETLKRAAVLVYSSDCGNSYDDPSFRAQAKLVDEAGPRIIPILTELVADPKRSPWFVGSVGLRALRFPFSPAFHQAMRARRTDPKFDADSGAFLSLYQYFAETGDPADLRWMESSISRFDDSRRRFAAEPIEKLRKRLSK